MTYESPTLLSFQDWETLTVNDLNKWYQTGASLVPHSLAAWGYRIGRGKPEHEDWSVYSEDMLHRCREDVRINAAIYPILIEETSTFGESIQLEHEVQRIISEQERTGVYFDSDRARGYVDELGRRVQVIDQQLDGRLLRKCRQVGATVSKPFKKDGTLSKMVMDWADGAYATRDTTFHIICNDGTREPIKGQVDTPIHSSVSGPFSRIEWIKTDLNSDKQVKEWLLTLGWKPKEWNISPTTGARTSPKLTPDSFGSLPGGLGEILKERVTWRHRASQIQGWLDKCREDHCLSAGANPLGTNTGRMRHRTVVNVPKAADFIPFGKEMRSLFTHRPGRRFIGHDASGLELRMLAHYMNDKEFTEQVLHGDIHSYNQRLAGLPTRDSAKTFIYAFIYGAGDAKLGSIVDGTKADGTRLRNTFLSALPSLGRLIEQVKKASLRGYLIGLDGRKIMMRKQDDGSVMQHKALNTLLQCAGAVVMKKSIVYLDEWSKDLDSMKVIDMHDEGQADVSEKDAELYAEYAVKSIVQAGTHFNLNIPLDAEAKIGDNWAETH